MMDDDQKIEIHDKELRDKQAILFRAVFEDHGIEKFKLHRDILKEDIRIKVCDNGIGGQLCLFTQILAEDATIPEAETEAKAKIIEDGCEEWVCDNGIGGQLCLFTQILGEDTTISEAETEAIAKIIEDGCEEWVCDNGIGGQLCLFTQILAEDATIPEAKTEAIAKIIEDGCEECKCNVAPCSLLQLSKVCDNGIGGQLCLFTQILAEDATIPEAETEAIAKIIEDGCEECKCNVAPCQLIQTLICKLSHFAAMYDRCLPLLKYLQENACDMNAETNLENITPLGIAVNHNQAETVKYLLSIKVDPNKGGVSPLREAIIYEYDEAFYLLLQAENIDLNWKDINGNPLVHHCLRAHPEFMEPLLRAGALADIASPNGSTPLLNAVTMNNVEMAELLIKYGANVNQTSRRGDPLIIMAVLRENEKMCRVMLEAGANPNHTDREGNSLLLLSTYDGSHELVQMLMRFGANARAANKQGYCPMHIAAWNGHINCINLFVSAGIPHDEQTLDKNTPLSLAAHGGHLNVIEILLPLKCNVNNRDKDLDTALHYATYNGMTKACELLIKHGADPDVQNRVNTTPLWNAVYRSEKEVVKLLLHANVKLEVESSGIDQHAQSDDVIPVYDEPKSPLWIAADNNAAEIALLLISSGYDLHRERWLIRGEFPEDFDDDALQALMTGYVQNPPRLVTRCRNFLRNYFGRDIHEKVSSLPIPTTLKSYITLSDLYE